MIPRLLEVKPLRGYRLWLTYEDGVKGTVDLSGLVGEGMFVLWEDEERFRQVRIGDGGELVWSDEVDLCADALYLQVTGKQPRDVFAKLRLLSESHA
nr:DUF2442 domain-containing protein [Ardenticatena sp.]